MVQFSVLSSTSLPVLESAVAGASRFVEAVRGASSGRAFSGSGGGATVFSDRQHVAASGRFAVETNAQSAAASNAVAAASLLQTADDALVEIGAKLDQLAALAATAISGDLSQLEREQLDAQFRTLRSDIDAIAATTAFNGVALLQGGPGPGGVLEISFKVGTGAAEHDEITISIAPASVADLSPALAGGSVATQAGAWMARTDITEAAAAVDAMRAGIAGDRQRFAAAYRNSQSMRQASGTVREALTSPSAAIDLSHVLATRIAEEGGIEITERALDRLRELLIGFDQRPSAASAQDDTPTAAEDRAVPAARGSSDGEDRSTA